MQEKKAWYLNGFLVVFICLLLVAGIIWSVVTLAKTASPARTAVLIMLIAVQALIIVLGLSSLTIVQPNESKVVTFFGKYVGTVLDSGFWMVVPFAVKKNVSLKVRNFNSQTLKVNDAEGNPVEIAAVVVFKVVDTAKAVFDVDDYETFVEIQSETAIRHIAAQYPYDSFSDDQTISLRGNSQEVANELMKELQDRLTVAGVQVLETRLTHLAYSPEIASAMLQRQQATAIVAARQHIVEGAVGMVDMALRQLKDKGIELDDERRAAMVNNLMVSIVSDRSVSPVINTGTLYN